jgi:hypothetical protein
VREESGENGGEKLFTTISGGNIIAVLIAAMTIAPISPSSATSPAVESACASDYFAYCSKYDPDSREVRACMRAHGSKLSERCIRALVAAGEVSRAKVERSNAAGR